MRQHSQTLSQTAIVALKYAHHYSKVDGVTVKESLDEAKSDYERSNETLVDWLQNNIDWEEIVEFTSHVCTKPKRSYADMFRASDWSVCK